MLFLSEERIEETRVYPKLHTYLRLRSKRVMMMHKKSVVFLPETFDIFSVEINQQINNAPNMHKIKVFEWFFLET